MAMASSGDEELNFKKRARRRLVGAVALVLLMVTVLPMVLNDQPPQAPRPEIDIAIPSQDAPGFAGSKIQPAPAAPANTAPISTPISAVPSSPVGDGNASQQAKPLAPKQTPLDQAAANAAPIKQADPEATQSAPLANADVGEQKKSGYPVQIGVYSDEAKAKQLQQKLASQGIKTYALLINAPQGKRVKLRAGPYASKAEANEALARLKALGYQPVLVNP